MNPVGKDLNRSSDLQPWIVSRLGGYRSKKVGGRLPKKARRPIRHCPMRKRATSVPLNCTANGRQANPAATRRPNKRLTTDAAERRRVSRSSRPRNRLGERLSSTYVR